MTEWEGEGLECGGERLLKGTGCVRIGYLCRWGDRGRGGMEGLGCRNGVRGIKEEKK